MKRFGIFVLALTYLTGATVSNAQDTTTKKEKKKKKKKADTTEKKKLGHIGRVFMARPVLHTLFTPARFCS
jgi:hypothetical protein